MQKNKKKKKRIIMFIHIFINNRIIFGYICLKLMVINLCFPMKFNASYGSDISFVLGDGTCEQGLQLNYLVGSNGF